MPSGIPPDEPEETPPPEGDRSSGEPRPAPSAPDEATDGTDEIPVHPDDRLWRHPSELARMRAAERAAAIVPPQTPTPRSARQGASSVWASRIPTSAVIAAGVAAVIASVGGLVALAYSGAADAADRPTALDGQTAAEPHTSIVAGSRRASGMIVDTDGVVIVAMDDPPERATLITNDRRAPVSLRSVDRHLALAAYQVDDADDPAAAAPASATTARPTILAGAAQSRRSADWALPTGASDLGQHELDWMSSEWGPVLMADVDDADVPPGTPLTDGGRLVGMTTRTSDGRTMAMPWPVLRSVGARLRAQPLPMGGLPAELSDHGDHPTVAKAWGDGALRSSDRVVAIDGHPISSADEAQAVAAFYPEGDTVRVRCERSGRAVTVGVKLE